MDWEYGMEERGFSPLCPGHINHSTSIQCENSPNATATPMARNKQLWKHELQQSGVLDIILGTALLVLHSIASCCREIMLQFPDTLVVRHLLSFFAFSN